MNWPKLNTQQIKLKVFDALGKNLNYRSENILGIPATYLDTDIFYDDAPFLKDAPFLSTLVANPNHIGCHTLDGNTQKMVACLVLWVWWAHTAFLSVSAVIYFKPSRIASAKA